MAVDLSGFGNLKTVDDYNKVNDMFLAQKAAAQLAQQTGQQDLQSKKNIYATQVLSAATAPASFDASGNPIYDQNAYNGALQHLAQQGVDVSTFSPDVTAAAQQVHAARLAQSPLSGLLNAAGKMDTNNITAAIAGGNVPSNPNAIQQAVLGGGPVVHKPAVQSQATPGVPTPNATQVAQAIGTPATITPGQFSTPQPSVDVPLQSRGAPNPDDYKDPTKTLAANQAAFSQAMDVYKSSPEYMKDSKKADSLGTEEGTRLGDAQKALGVMMGNAPAVVSRTNGIIKFSPDASSGLGVNPEGGGMYPAFDNSSLGQKLFPKSSEANTQLQKLAAQGAFPEIAAALSNSSMKGNKFLETLMNNGLSINMQTPADVKASQAQANLAQYIQSVKSIASQIRSQGQPAPSDEMIDKYFVDQGATLPKTYNSPQAVPAQTTLDPSQWKVKVLK